MSFASRSQNMSQWGGMKHWEGRAWCVSFKTKMYPKGFQDGLWVNPMTVLKQWFYIQAPVVQKWHVPTTRHRYHSGRGLSRPPYLRTCRYAQLLRIKAWPWRMQHEWRGKLEKEPEGWLDLAWWMWHMPDSHVVWKFLSLLVYICSLRPSKCTITC